LESISSSSQDFAPFNAAPEIEGVEEEDEASIQFEAEIQAAYQTLMDQGISYDEATKMIETALQKGYEEDENEAEEVERRKEQLMKRVRIVPASPSYFTGKPSFTDDYLSLQALLRKYQTLPVLPPGQAPRIAWKSVEQYKAMVGAEPVRSARYHRLIEVLQRLNYINPALMPDEVKHTLDRYKRGIDLGLQKPKSRFANEDGVALGVGRRKTSTARAYVVEGEGEVLINGKNLAQFFSRMHDRESAIWALKATERVDKYNVFGLVSGGGVTGQAEAMTLAVAKALMVHEPLLKPALRRAGCVTRDPRMVERKKPGHLKARKKPAWVKR